MGLFLQNHLDLCSIHVSLLSRDLNSPKSSDSNRHVSPTPTLRHQAKKLAVLSRAKNEPEGALCRHGILRWGTLCKREVSTCLHLVLQENDVSRRVFAFWMTLNAVQTCAYGDKNASSRLACAARPQNFDQNTELQSFNLLWFLFHLLRLWFQHRIKDRFHTDQYGRWRRRKPALFYQPFNDLGSNDMLMGFFSPHTVCPGRFIHFAVVLYRICASVQWERCDELMLETRRLLWVFFCSFQAVLQTILGYVLSLNDLEI